MKPGIRIVLVAFLIGTILTACGPSQAELETASTQAVANVFATQTALSPTDTSIPEPTTTATSLPSATPSPSATPNLAATAVAATVEAKRATQRVEQTATVISALATQRAIDTIWDQLVSDGVATYSKGELTAMEDLEESWAQRLWYKWWSFGINLSDFIILTHIEWKYPDDANLGAGGCGFVIRVKDKNNQMLVVVSPRSRVVLSLMTLRGIKGQTVHWEDPNLSKYSSVLPPTSGSADFWLVAEKEFISAYVNGKMTTQWYVAATNSGDIGYTILSGTNNLPGTYCKFTNTRIWELVK